MKKEAKSYKILSFVSVLMFLCLLVFVYAEFAAVWDTPTTGGTIALSDLSGDNYTFVVNVTVSTAAINISNVTLYRRIAGQTTWIEWASNTTYNLTQYNISVNLNGTSALNGSFELNITVNNITGVSNYSVINVYIDTIKPVVTLTNVTNVNTSSNTVNYQYTASDYNLSTCQMYFGATGGWVMIKENATMNLSATTITISNTNASLADGVYYFSAYCNDTLGNSLWNTTNTSFTVDTAGPTINSVTLSQAIIRQGTKKINVTVNATNGLLGVKNVTVNGLSLSHDSTSSDTWSKIMNITRSPLNVVATDYNGLTATDNTAIALFDNSAPVTVFMNMTTINTTGVVWYNTPLHIALYATDIGGANVNNITYRNSTSGTWVLWTTNLTFGSNITGNTFQFRANDTAGNVEGYQTKTIKIDMVEPSVTINSLSETIVGPSQSIVVSTTITDARSGVDASTLTAWHNGTGRHNASNKQSLSILNGRYTGTLTAPSVSGSYVITVNATDNTNTGNSNSSANTSFTVSVSVPTISPNKANNTYVANQSTVTFTITDANRTFYNTSENNLSTYANVDDDSSVGVLINATSSTTFNIFMHANWSDSNTTNRSYTYLVDAVIPPIAFSNPSSNQTVNGTTTITVASSDGQSGTSNVSFYVNNVLLATDATSPYSYNLNTVDYSDGPIVLNITAIDNVGNINRTNITVIVNNSRLITRVVSDGAADLGGTILENQVPTITGLNSSTAIVIVGKDPFITGGSTTSLSSTKMYVNITADTAATARVYFRLTTSQIIFSDTNDIWVYMDHDEDGTYEDSIQAQYIGLNGNYYDFYFTTTSFSIFAIGIKTPGVVNEGGGTGGGSGGPQVFRIPLKMTSNSFSLAMGDKGTITFNNQDYIIRLSSLKSDSETTVSIGSKSVTFTEGESANIDVDGDGTNDVNVKTIRISSSKAYFEIRKLYVAAAPVAEPVAEPETIAEPEPIEPEEIIPPPAPEPAAVEPTNYTGWIIAIAVIIIGLIAALAIMKKKQ